MGLVELGALSSHLAAFLLCWLFTDAKVWFELFGGVELCVVLYLLTLLHSHVSFPQ